mgnify:CR=1 FL=1
MATTPAATPTPAPPRTEPSADQVLALLDRAQALARRAMDAGHHPFGALLVAPDHATVLMEQGNVDSVNHAEAVLARDAARQFAPNVLWGCTLYTTVEPCAMCAGALIQARVKRLVYGAPDERAGAVASKFRICDTDFLNHRIQITSGVLENECRELMQSFFRRRRPLSQGAFDN